MPTRRSPATRLPCLAAALLAALALTPLHAQQQGPDTRAPVIEIETLDESTADATQTFTAQVADDRELAGVTFHHRRAGQQPFARVPMRALGDSDYYGISLPTDPDDLRSIEYYVQALDESGNRTVSGFAFDPHVRTLRPQVVAAAPPPPERQPAETSGSRRWWAVALGVLAVGAVVSLAGSDDGGGGGGGGDTVPLTVDLSEPVAR